MSYRWPWQVKQAPTSTDDSTAGCCQYCVRPAIVCLNGVEWLCWDHYVERSRPAHSIASDEAVRKAAERVVWFDWTGNDADACQAMDELRRALEQNARASND